MKGALIILAVTVAFGLLLFFNEQRRRRGTACSHDVGDNRTAGDSRTDSDNDAPPTESDDRPAATATHPRPTGCCGRHIVCEKLDSPYTEKPQYYDDEELDDYSGTPEDGYTPSQIEEFREILFTLRTEEIRGWLDSLALRRIALPLPLRDEVIMLLEEN